MLRTLQSILFGTSVFGFLIGSIIIPSCVYNTVMHYFLIYLRTICNLKVHVHGSKQLLKNNHIYMANHYEGVDYLVLYSLITQPLSRPCYVIGKDDLLGRQYPLQPLSTIIDFLIKQFYESGYIIPYTRGNKESGQRVRNQVLNLIKNNNVLIFPEGRSWRKGACHEFKPGMFEVAEQSNKSIVPITLKYRNFDGKNKGEKCVLNDWMNLVVDVFVHDEVQPKAYNLMLEETFEKISSKN